MKAGEIKLSAGAKSNGITVFSYPVLPRNYQLRNGKTRSQLPTTVTTAQALIHHAGATKASTFYSGRYLMVFSVAEAPGGDDL